MTGSNVGLSSEPSAPQRPRILLVEDDEGVRRSLQLLLHGRGYDVRSYPNAESLLSEFDPTATALIADFRLSDGSGLGVLRGLRRAGWSGDAILITAFPSPAVTDAARAAGFRAVLEKPVRAHDLFRAFSESSLATQGLETRSRQ